MRKYAVFAVVCLIVFSCKKDDNTSKSGSGGNSTTSNMSSLELSLSAHKWLYRGYKDFQINNFPNDTVVLFDVPYYNPSIWMNLTNVWWTDTTGTYNISAYKIDPNSTCPLTTGQKNWKGRGVDSLIFPVPSGPDVGIRYRVELLTNDTLILHRQSLGYAFTRYYFHK